MINDPRLSLTLLESVQHSSGVLFNVTDRCYPTWKHSMRRIGGFWQASCDYSGLPFELEEMFINGILREIRAEIPGATIWQGYIAAMAYTKGALTYVRTLADTANAIKAKFTRIGDSLLSNGSAESGAWTVYNGATVTQSQTWVTDGDYSCKIVVADAAIRGARISGAGYALTISAGQEYTCLVKLQVDSGSWRVSVNRSDTDESLGAFSTRGKSGQFVASFKVPKTNTFGGTVDFRITSEASPGTIYGDGALFIESAEPSETNWNIDAVSVSEFGRIESLVVRGVMSNAAANVDVLTLLTQAAWFRTQAPDQFSIGRKENRAADKLTLYLAGYSHTLANRILKPIATDTMSNLVTTLMSTQADYVSLDYADTNATSYTIENRAPITVWKALSDIGYAGDASGNLWSLGVTANRKLRYEQTPTDPQFSIRNDEIYYFNGGVADRRLVVPSYIQIDDMPIGAGVPTSNANDDPRRIFVEEVEYVPALDQLNFKRKITG